MRRYTGPHRTDLERFMRRVDATSSSVANETGLSQPTVWRAAAGIAIPDYQTVRLLQEWAAEKARGLRLPKRDRLSDWPPESEVV